MKHFILIAAALMAVACSTAKTNGLSVNQEQQLDSLLSATFPDGEPGAAVLIMRGDDVIYDKGFGLAELACGSEGDFAARRVDGNTFFNIASCSKQFTAVAVLQLASKGLLKLDDKVNKYLTEYTDPVWDKVTIHHLLCHTSGIPDERGYLTYEQKIAGGDSLAMEYLQFVNHLNFEPGEKFEYMNTTYVLLGELVHRITGLRFAEYVRKNIFDPAGMEHALYYSPEADVPNMAHAYRFEDGQWQERDYGEVTFFVTGPDGGIYTSTHELANWEKALRSGAVLSPEWLQIAWTPRIANAEKSMYCYGWGTEGEGESQRIYHTGGNGGFKTYILRYPATEYMFVVLAARNDWDIPQLQSQIDQIVTGAAAPRDVLNF